MLKIISFIFCLSGMSFAAAQAQNSGNISCNPPQAEFALKSISSQQCNNLLGNDLSPNFINSFTASSFQINKPENKIKEILVNKDINDSQICGAYLQCMAMAKLALINEREFSNDNIKGQSPAPKKSAAIQTQANGLTVAESVSVRCESGGIYTLDYDKCDEFATYYEGLEAASAIVQQGQQVYYQGKAVEHATDAQKEMANDATAAAKAQKKGFQDQQQMFVNNSAMDAAKAAYLLKIYNEMPDKEQLLSQCKSLKDQNLIKACEVAINTNSMQVLANEGAKGKMRQILIKAGVSSLTNFALSEQAANRAEKVDGIIAKIDAFKPNTTPGLEDALNASYCQMNPADVSKCASNNVQALSAIGDNVIEFSGGATGISSSGQDLANNDSKSSNTTSTSGSNVSPSNIVGATATTPIAGDTMDKAAGAQVTQGGGSGQSPQGGGGGMGMGGGGGATAGAPPKKGEEAQAIAAGTSKTASYSGGASGIALSSGLGLNRPKATGKENENPFQNMFGDKQKAVDDGKLWNFRGIASISKAQGEVLFDIITKRYQKVTEDKRLDIKE